MAVPCGVYVGRLAGLVGEVLFQLTGDTHPLTPLALRATVPLNDPVARLEIGRYSEAGEDQRPVHLRHDDRLVGAAMDLPVGDL